MIFQSNLFGEKLPDEDPAGTGSPFDLNLRFPGQYYDAESGLHYNYFRDYEAATGTYVQSDPIGLWGGISTYGYANQNPLHYVDPYGLAAQVCAIPAIAPACWAAITKTCGAIAGAAIGIAGAVSYNRNTNDCNPDWNGGDGGSGNSCDDNNDDYCREERRRCTELCAEAYDDFRRPHVVGSSMTQCILSCLPEECGGEPKRKGYK